MTLIKIVQMEYTDRFGTHLPALHKMQLYDNNISLLKYIFIEKSRVFGKRYELLIGFLFGITKNVFGSFEYTKYRIYPAVARD